MNTFLLLLILLLLLRRPRCKRKDKPIIFTVANVSGDHNITVSFRDREEIDGEVYSPQCTGRPSA